MTTKNDYITFEVCHSLPDLKTVQKLIREYLFNNPNRKSLPEGIHEIVLKENVVQISQREYNDYKESSSKEILIRDDIDKPRRKRKATEPPIDDGKIRDPKEQKEIEQKLEYGKILKCEWCGKFCENLSGLTRHSIKCKERK